MAVYIILARNLSGEAEYAKIGYSNTVGRRLAHLQTACPLSLEVLAICENGCKSLEGILQTELRSYGAGQAATKEWFNAADVCGVYMTKWADNPSFDWDEYIDPETLYNEAVRSIIYTDLELSKAA